MTENEAKLVIKRLVGISPSESIVHAVNMATDALEEIQQYRAIGTIEECRDAMEKHIPKKRIKGKLIDADKIKQSVTNEMLKAELNSPIYCTLECVIADIDRQPITFDVDKVVKQMMECVKESSNVDYNRAMIEAIEIIESELSNDK